MTPTRTLVLSAVLLAGGYAAWHFTRPRDTPTAAGLFNALVA